jgi:V/A-type H+-transporting ATPase subunit A
VIKVSGPLVVAGRMEGARMYDIVRVGQERLIGEIVELKEDQASIQVYEETSGMGPGEPVYLTGCPLSVELGPGLIASIYDGIQRSLDVLAEKAGAYIARGVDIPAIDRERKWYFKPILSSGDEVAFGDILGNVQESPAVVHRIMVPYGIAGTIEKIYEGDFCVTDVIAKIKKDREVYEVRMLQEWPVRRGRPVKEKLPPCAPLVTGQRVIDTFFTLTKGGTACIPGPFGSGKTVVLHQLAKWSDADIIVYVGCGERGNEMTDVLLEFPQLTDPRTGQSLINRTVMIANTSNMPVAAREASIYTGITIAEYYRDMGYRVAIMADSTSRWAEALREMSGRLEEMPGEEGYPAYLAARVAEFYERAGRAVCASGNDRREGSISVIGAVSPPGGDLSDPVVQATLRMVKVFWGLEDRLASMRHFPAINWLTSYSLYLRNIADFLRKEVGSDWIAMRDEAMKLLQEEASLEEIVKLVGIESLSARDRLVLETTKSIREDFLHQHAFHEVDTYTSLAKQYRMMKLIIGLHQKCQNALEGGAPLHDVLALPVREEIARAKYIPEDELGSFDKIADRLDLELNSLFGQKGD